MEETANASVYTEPAEASEPTLVRVFRYFRFFNTQHLQRRPCWEWFVARSSCGCPLRPAGQALHAPQGAVPVPACSRGQALRDALRAAPVPAVNSPSGACPGAAEPWGETATSTPCTPPLTLQTARPIDSLASLPRPRHLIEYLARPTLPPQNSARLLTKWTPWAAWLRPLSVSTTSR